MISTSTAPGKFKDGEVEGRTIWRKCECDCPHPLKWRKRGHDDNSKSAGNLSPAADAAVLPDAGV
jgi:hypothetical protein